MIRLLFLLLLTGFVSCRRFSSSESHSIEQTNPSSLNLLTDTKRFEKILPSKESLETFGIRFIDALIKKGQMEMAKGAFKTQLEVLEKVNPKQYAKYKDMKIEDLAADAVRQQAQLSAMQPRTGNAFVDMLHENGIPIGSSIKGVEQAIKTQKEIENNDPSEQIAKAVFEKFRQQILPGLVANIISGRNPFRMPNTGGGMSGMRQMQQMPEEIRQKLIAQQRSQAEESTVELNNENEIRRSPRRNDEDEHDLEDLETRLRSSPRLAILLKNPSIHSLLSNRRLHDEPLGRSLSDRFVKNTNLLEDFGTRSALALGINEMMAEDEEESSENQIRRSPLKLHPEFVASLSGNPEIAEALARLNYKVDEVDGLLIPKRRLINPHPQPGFLVPRKIPTKPRKMIPILVGVPDIDNAISTEWGTIRRAPSEMDVKPMKEYKSRVIANLKNNPNVAPLFMNDDLERKLRGREILSPEQKGLFSSHSRQIHPRMLGANTLNLSNIDKQVVQTMEERPIPPLFWIPKGKHTRIRWTGAQEKEIPGLGTRLIFPSLDPTAPALNTAMSTQGRARDEWDTMFKIPNNWNPGDEVGFNVKQKSERFIGGTGNFDMPASHL